MLSSSISAAVGPLAYPTDVRYQGPNGITPAASSGPTGTTPAQMVGAYGVNQILFGSTGGTGAGETIAIVDAYDDPNAAGDLDAFDSFWHLQAMNQSGGPTFTKINQTGGSTPPNPASLGGWGTEISLDIEWAHVIALQANIILVEANTNGLSDLLAAVDTARNIPGVVAVSMSWGSSEFSGETSLDSHFTTPAGHTPITFSASSGDSGQPGLWPAYSPNVVAVGGTSLYTDSSADYLLETGWSTTPTNHNGTGGGISTQESQPSYQTGKVTQSTTKRTIPDVSMDADPNTGVSIYDTYDFGSSTPWAQFGGTSLASPMFAALVAIADQGRVAHGQATLNGRTDVLPDIYSFPHTVFHDVATGSNNGFSAGSGYDLVTGEGSPTAAFVQSLSGYVGSDISGQVFSDIDNGNGVRDGSEAALSGVTVYRDDNNNGVFDSVGPTPFASTDVPTSIITTGTYSSIDTVSGLPDFLTDINVTVNFNFTLDSGLILELVSPSGNAVTLAAGLGGSNGANYTNTTFDDAAGNPITTAAAPFTGTFHPISPLSVFNGSNPDGTWRLVVQDTASGKTGSLTGWSLQIAASDPSTTSNTSGNYTLGNLLDGSYNIREAPPIGYGVSTPVGGVYSPTIVNGQTVTGQNFGDQLAANIPSTPILLPASDTGASNTDADTSFNNSSGNQALQFSVGNTAAGSTVNVLLYSYFAPHTPFMVLSGTAAGSSTTLFTDGSTVIPDGLYAVFSQAVINGVS